MPDPPAERYSRNLGLLGANGQMNVRNTRVGIVGVGGLGSHVIQQLAYLGTRQFVVVDQDLVELSNLNRLVGARPSDVGSLKVDVAVRVISRCTARC